MIQTTPITQAFANERIRQAIRSVPDKRTRMGLAKLDGRLAKEGASPAIRLHVVAAIKQLGRESAATRHDRLLHATASLAEDDD